MIHASEIIRFNQKVGDVDFAISFDDGFGIRTGFVRFKNNKSAERFNNYLNLLIFVNIYLFESCGL